MAIISPITNLAEYYEGWSGKPKVGQTSDAGITNTITNAYEDKKAFTTIDISKNSLAGGGARNYKSTSDITGTQMRTGGNFDDHGKLSEYYISHIGKREFKSNTQEAKANNQEAPLWLQQPFLNRGPSTGKPKPALKEGVLTAPLFAIARDAMFLGSPKGLMFLIKQFGYQLTNPKGEFYDPSGTVSNPLHNDRIFNPLAMLGAPAGNLLGVHLDRHGKGPFNERESTYEHRIRKLNQDQGTSFENSFNRLIKLGQEAGYSRFQGGGQNAIDGMPEGEKKGTGLAKLKAFAKKLSAKLAGGRTAWDTLSGLGGPHSVLGIGSTTQYRHSSGNPLQEDYSFWTLEKPYKKDAARFTFNTSVRDSDENEGFHLGPLDATTTDDMVIMHPADSTEQLDELASSDALESFKPSTGGGRGVTALGISAYKAFEYGDIPTEQSTTNNFIKETDAAKGNVTTDYAANNVQARWGLGDYGRWDKSSPEDDAYVNANSFSDAIKFILGGIQFRAIFDGDITDNNSFTWKEHTYVGRDTALYTYDKYSRSSTFKIMVPSFTANETIKNYRKVNNLLANCRATYNDDGIPTAPINYITLGDYWTNKPCIVESINNTVITHDWDIAFGEGRQTTGKELCKHFQLDVNLKFVSVPQDSSNAWYFGNNIISG